MPVGNCTQAGVVLAGRRERLRCAPALSAVQRPSAGRHCRANSADNGWGVCVCDPGYVYTVAAGAIFGPTNCVRRTDELCGAASDPGTCEPGGTWNSATANCDCDDGYERSDDGRSCECATDDAQQTGYRASVLFPNPQSLFDGLRVGFVNTSSGNLTFRRRDIVTRAQGPVVFARVYDSRIAADADFGPGWRLSLAEELLVDGDAATYVDEAGARHTFAQTGTAWTASPPTPRHAATTLDFADVDGIRVAVLADGATVRTFEQADAAGARYVVTLVRTPARELVLDYDGGRLAAVSHDGGTLFDVERDRDGRIAAVRDDHGRSVRYTYDADGRLETVRDIAGSDWRYLYRDDGLLGGAVDPEGRTYLAAAYDAGGRVARAFGGRLHDYAYAPEGTTVAEDTGEVHALTRNAAGVTTALSSTTGASWSLTLDGANRVSTLTLPERTIGYAYGGHGKVATMTVADSVSGTTRARSYDYDLQGRLVSVSGGGAGANVTYAAGLVRIDEGGEVFEHEVDDRGRVAWVRRGADPEIRVERDSAGDIVAVSQGYRSVLFGRDSLGRIVDATHGDGHAARYFYDDLGSRVLTERDDGSSMAYEYDASGTMTAMEETGRDGTIRQWTATPDAIGRSVYDWSEMPDPGRGPLARPAEMSGSYHLVDRTFPIHRPRQTQFGRGVENDRGTSSERSRIGDWSGDRSARDDRATVLNGDRRPDRRPGYRAAASRATEALGGAPMEAHVRHLDEAHEVAHVARRLLAGAASAAFEVASNPVFQPVEHGAAGSGPSMQPVAGSAAARNCVAPDEIDRIIQEYRNLNRVPLPARSDFVTEHSSAHFDESELNTSDYSHFIPGVMTEIAEAVRTRYNGKVDNDAATDYGIAVSSGYRNPRRSDRVGGVSTSKHQWGKAVDLVPGLLPPGKTESQAMELIERAADEAGYDARNEGDHVHVETNP